MNERALFAGFRNLVIEQFEYEPVRFISRGIFKDSWGYAPAGGITIDGNVEEGPFSEHGR